MLHRGTDVAGHRHWIPLRVNTLKSVHVGHPGAITGAARTTLTAAAILVSIETLSLINRGTRGASDIGVYYRTCTLLRQGVRAMYPRADAITGWPISMPPVGFAIFQPFSGLGAWGSSAAWAALNVGLLGLSLLIQTRVLLRTGELGYMKAWPWTAAVLLILSAGSIQVGQFSVLFVTCWLLFLDAFATSTNPATALWLAIPAAVKIYPIGLVAIPLSIYLEAAVRGQTRFASRVAMVVAWLVAGMLIAMFVIPALPYGIDTFTLNAAWWRGVILNHAQMNYLQDLRAITNQSLDTVLLRYLSYDPPFHTHYPLLPHLALGKAVVLHVADAARLAIIGISVAAVWRHARTRASSRAALIEVAALWSAALYNVLPETKSRYAVYMFIAFLPWVARAADPARPHARLFGAVVLGAILSTLGVLPDVLEAWGAGFIGPFVLWIGNVRFVAEGVAGDDSTVRGVRA